MTPQKTQVSDPHTCPACGLPVRCHLQTFGGRIRAAYRTCASTLGGNNAATNRETP